MRKGYRVPTPIQRKVSRIRTARSFYSQLFSQCIPLVMDGKDVVAMARTGSGKTAAFLLPMFERLKTHSTKVRPEPGTMSGKLRELCGFEADSSWFQASLECNTPSP